MYPTPPRASASDSEYPRVGPSVARAPESWNSIPAWLQGDILQHSAHAGRVGVQPTVRFASLHTLERLHLHLYLSVSPCVGGWHATVCDPRLPRKGVRSRACPSSDTLALIASTSYTQISDVKRPRLEAYGLCNF